MAATETQKITVHVPVGLLERAQRAAKGGVTETVRMGLELLAAEDAYEGIRRWRGKYKFSIDLDELRQDRELPRWPGKRPPKARK